MIRFSCLLYTFAVANAVTWYKSQNAGGALFGGVWTDFNKAHNPTNSIGTNLDSQRFSKVGDKASLKVTWQSEGGTCKMSSDHWTQSKYQYECAEHDVQEDGASSCPFCLTGTGDFRVFLGSSKNALKDAFSLPGYNKSTRDFLGYEFRIFPHAMQKSHYYVPAKGSPRPGSSVVPTNVCFGFEDHRVWPSKADKKSSFGGFEIAYGAKSYLMLVLEMKSEDEVEVSFEMDNSSTRRSFIHKVSPSSKTDNRKDVPSEVNVLVINYPNERGYTRLELTDLTFTGNQVKDALIFA